MVINLAGRVHKHQRLPSDRQRYRMCQRPPQFFYQPQLTINTQLPQNRLRSLPLRLQLQRLTQHFKSISPLLKLHKYAP